MRRSPLVRVRPAKAEDIHPLEAVISRWWKVDVDHRKHIAHSDSILLVAERSKEGPTGKKSIVGTGLMLVTDWNKTGYMAELAVADDFKRKGVARALMSEFSNLARKRRLRAIIAETQPDNSEAIGFYLSNGFRFCGFNDRYYTNSPKTPHEVAIFFSLDL